MDAIEPQVRYFFIGFVAAQFISGWVSGPLILVVLFLYVFLGEATRKLGQILVARLPGFLLNRFVQQQQQQQQPPQPQNIGDFFDDSATSLPMSNSSFTTPFPPPAY
jgi:hypothetical protein